MKRKVWVIVIAFSGLLILCCIGSIFYILRFVIFGDPTGYLQEKIQGRDPFYSGAGELDSDRFPLIKPYEAVRIHPTEKGYGWQVDFVLPYNQREIDDGVILQIEKIAYDKGTFMIYSSYVNEPNKNIVVKNYHWFVIIPSKNIETGFETEEQFNTFLTDNNIQNPKWIDSDTIYYQYANTGCLVWIPGCTSQ